GSTPDERAQLRPRRPPPTARVGARRAHGNPRGAALPGGPPMSAPATSPATGVRSWAGIAPSVVLVMWRREMIRYWRDRSQIFGGFSRTVLWLVILGFGLGAALREIEGYSYAQYILPGVIVLNVLFASLQCAIS